MLVSIPFAEHLKYLEYVMRHKYYVFLECKRLGIPLQGIFHDLSKFFPDEWNGYVGYSANDYFNNQITEDCKDAEIVFHFDLSWALHQKRNKHHWQYWRVYYDSGKVKTLPIPDLHRREMLADWRGASRTRNNGVDKTPEWWEANKDKIELNFETRRWIQFQIEVQAQKQEEGTWDKEANLQH